jgi:hypothetical protein
MPTKPATRSTPDEVANVESALDIEDLVNRTFDARSGVRIGAPEA